MGDSKYEIDEHRLEVENRIKNLMWTVSGDYELNVKLDMESFKRSKYISLYDAVKQGAFAKYFDKEALAMYLVKKVYFDADESSLMSIAQLCVDAAAHDKISKERLGVEGIRKKAYLDILEHDFRRLTSSVIGRAKIAWMQSGLNGSYTAQKNITDVVERLKCLEDSSDTMDIIRAVDELYNQEIDKGFERKHGGLDSVLAVTMEELAEYEWGDLLAEEMYEDTLERYLNQITDSVTSMTPEEEEEERKEDKKDTSGTKIILVNEEALKKMYSYVELNYGRTYLSDAEQQRINYQLCRGAHSDCSLYFTEGILRNPVRENYQYKYALRQQEQNERAYFNQHRIVKRNIAILTDTLKKALIIRNETDYVRSDNGAIVPRLLWKVNRTTDIKLFTRELKKDNSDFVVDILIDASGSQKPRQTKVAIQGYIISEALSNVGIPHRVMSFCTFWDYTIMHRFREYDDGKEANRRIFEYTSTSNNRDGLAIRAGAEGLVKRQEENKILIVLSDGRPNDMIVNRPNSRNPKPYSGEYAVKDTALEVRRLRNQGISVLGVFAGEQKDLNAEKKIFGKDFAYIQNIVNFSNIVGVYLKKQLDDMY